jgi:ferrochelatase
VQEPIGLLLTNVGTPDAPTAKAVRRYLREFLSDRRVVDLPRALWLPILHLVILTFRPRRSAHAYASIWTEQGSPLLVIVENMAAALEAALRDKVQAPVHVAVGMAYGNPSVRRGFEELRDRGCRRILVLPLYPQYSSPTTGSSFDAVSRTLTTWRWVPELRWITSYHTHPLYIEALARSVRQAWEKDGVPDRLLVSFHGMPKRYDAAGDPYRGQCEETARLLTDALQLETDQWLLAFQSRFGREEWLMPYTDVVLHDWGRQEIGRVDVVCPGFAADCLETLEEIAIRGRETFLKSGGRELRYIPALNERPAHIAALSNLVLQHLAGWDLGPRLA